jgi:hypothetical protein
MVSRLRLVDSARGTHRRRIFVLGAAILAQQARLWLSMLSPLTWFAVLCAQEQAVFWLFMFRYHPQQ